MKTVFLFPGQGSQKAGMLEHYALSDQIVDTVYSETKEQTGLDPVDMDAAQRLRSTVYVQVCLLIAGVISARRLQAKGLTPDFVAGHSVGAFAAAVIAEVISFKQALSLVRTRAT